jgi:YVTN family beta-propeller protein
VIDTATNKVVATVAVGNVPFNVAVTPDGNHAYVANAGSSNVSVIDTVANTAEPTVITVGNSPVKVAVTPDGKRAYVTNLTSNNVSVIDTAKNTWRPRSRWGTTPGGSRSRRMGNTPMSLMRAPTLSR